MREKVKGRSAPAQYGFIEDSVKALGLEIKKLKEDGGKEIFLFDGEYLGMSNNVHLYFFNLEEEVYLMDDAPVRVKCNRITTEGVAIYCQGFEVVLALNDLLEHPLKKAILQSEPWKLLEALQDRLLELPEKGNIQLARSVVALARSFSPADKSIYQGQARAIEKALKDRVTFIWGPPGTGKTYTLAQIALKSFQAGESVLILSHANIAVDGAIEAIARQMPEQTMITMLDEEQVFPIVRYGYSRSEFLRNHQYYSSFCQAMNFAPEFADKIKRLEKKREQTSDRLKKAEYMRKLSTLKEKIRKIEKEEIIPNTKIVGTTISKAQVDEALFKKHFDVVLLDEASMAYIPQSLYAAGLARKRIVYIGDFKQLLPIAMAEGYLVDKWLKRDIFEFSQVKQQVEEGVFPPHLAMLNEQRRMHPSISGFVITNIYNGLLQDHESVGDNRLSSEVLHLMDTSQMLSITMRDINDSRFNVLQAFLSVIIAAHYCKEQQDSVGIITPYAAQSRLINNILKDIFGFQKWPIKSATVHRFQGSERDTIIFDTVDSFRMKAPGVLLTGQEREQAQRLINVAVTRAKKQFITVANMRYCRDRLSQKNILHKLLMYLQSKGSMYNFMGKYIGGKEQFHQLTNKKFRIDYHPNFDGTGTEKLLSRVIKDMTEGERIYISCPKEGEITRRSMEEAFKRVSNMQNKEIIIKAENKEQLPSDCKRFAENDAFAWLPLTIIDNKIVHYGFPLCVDGQVRDALLIKFVGEATASFLTSQLGFDGDMGSLLTGDDSINFRTFVENKFYCPRCKETLTVKRSRKTSKYFIGCSGFPNCDYVADDMLSKLKLYLQQYPVVCKECGGTMAAKLGSNGVFLGCSNYYSIGCRNAANVGSVC